MFLCCIEILSGFRSKLDFFTKFSSYSKIWPKALYYSTWSSAKFCQKWLRENSPFLYFFLIRIHVLMLSRNFEWILIKIGFFINFKVTPKAKYCIVMLVSSCFLAHLACFEGSLVPKVSKRDRFDFNLIIMICTSMSLSFLAP